MDTNKQAMMAFLSSMTEEQAAAFMQMLGEQQAPTPTEGIAITCHADVADEFAVFADSELFAKTIELYLKNSNKWSPWLFWSYAADAETKHDIITTDAVAEAFADYTREMLTDSDRSKKLQQATAQILGLDFEVRYKAADTVSTMVSWAFDATGRGIEWVGKRVVDAGLWTQDHAPDAGNLAGKPVRWATDVVDGAKGKVDDFKEAYKQVRDKATE